MKSHSPGRKPPVQCVMCDRWASGVHYGVHTCEGCKAFFKRGARRIKKFVCISGDGSCRTRTNMKRRCKACRFRQCLDVGMQRVAVISSVPLTDVIAVRQADTEDNGKAQSTLELQTQYRKKIPSGITVVNRTAERSPEEDDLDPERLVNLLAEIQRLPRTETKSCHFLPFGLDGTSSKDPNKQQMISTITAVYTAIQITFEDQNIKWAEFQDQALTHGHVVNQPEATLPDILLAINQHNMDTLIRMQTFASMLPGMNELETPFDTIFAGIRSSQWKIFVSKMIHHAPYFTDNEAYFTIGPRQYHYCVYWKKQISQWNFQLFLHLFCRMIRQLGLELSERYFLVAIILTEPAEDDQPNIRQSILHRHYTDALLTLLTDRCDNGELAVITRKLDVFFDFLKVVHQFVQYYFLTPENVPPCAKAITPPVSGIFKSTVADNCLRN